MAFPFLVDWKSTKERTMNRKMLTTLIICGTITSGMLEPAMAGKGKCGRKGEGTLASVAVLAEVIASDLLFMHEEETLALDVYLAMHGEYGLRVFDNHAYALE